MNTFTKLSLTSLLALFLFTASITAQTSFRQVYSNPDEVYSGYIGLHYFAVDAGFSNTSGASLLSIGAEALFPVNPKLRAEGYFLYSLFSLEKEGLPFLMNAGAEYALFSKTRDKNVNVLLAFSYERDYSENKDTNTWEGVELPAAVERELNVRGGLYLRNSALEYEQANTYYNTTNLFHAGVYAGIGYTKRLYMHVQDDRGYTFAFARQVRPFADIMLLPTSVDLTAPNGATLTLEESLGWRAGLTWQMNPITKALNFDRKIGFFGNLLYRLEVGQRPIDGFYITTGLAYTLKKLK